MILVDTSVWIDHLHRAEPMLGSLLQDADVCVHPMIIGELALGTLRNRTVVLGLLAGLTDLPVANHREVLLLVEARSLHGRGLSLIDAQLLASLLLSRTVALWTRDRRLRSAAEDLGVAASTLT